jgi:hypothetical protein
LNEGGGGGGGGRLVVFCVGVFNDGGGGNTVFREGGGGSTVDSLGGGGKPDDVEFNDGGGGGGGGKFERLGGGGGGGGRLREGKLDEPELELDPPEGLPKFCSKSNLAFLNPSAFPLISSLGGRGTFSVVLLPPFACSSNIAFILFLFASN